MKKDNSYARPLHAISALLYAFSRKCSFAAWLIFTSYVVSAYGADYTVSPVRSALNPGIGFTAYLLGSGDTLTNGSFTFIVYKSDGSAFGSAGAIRLCDKSGAGGCGAYGPDTAYSTGVGSVSVSNAFTHTGTKTYFLQRVSTAGVLDSSFKSGEFIVTRYVPPADTTPPVLSIPTASPPLGGIINGTFTATDASNMPVVAVQLSRSGIFPSTGFATCLVNASPVSPTTAGGSGTYGYTASNVQCPGLTGVLNQVIYFRSYAQDAAGNSAYSASSFVLDPGNQPPAQSGATATRNADGSVSSSVYVSDIDRNAFGIAAYITNSSGTAISASRKCLIADCTNLGLSDGTYSFSWTAAEMATYASGGGTFTVQFIATDSNGNASTAFSNSFVVPLPYTVNDLQPRTGIVGGPVLVTVTGTGFLSTLDLQISNQSPSPCSLQAGWSATSATFSCALSSVGAQTAAVRPQTPSVNVTSFPFTVSAATTTGVCGAAAGVATATRPSANLCSVGTASAVTGTGPWSWTCTGTNNTPVPCTAPGVSPVVTSVSPVVARVDVLQDFVVTGTNMASGMAFAMTDCECPNNACPEVGTGTATQRTFQCTPRLPGTKTITVKATPAGATLKQVDGFVDNPTRTGDASRRGIPAVMGVSLWNGNYHYESVDMEVPGKGLPFVFSWAYNTYYWDYVSQRGATDNYNPWRHNWDLRIGYVNGNTSHIYVQREDGSGDTFYKDTNGVWYPIEQGNFATLNGDTPAVGQTTVTLRSGRIYVFQNPDLGGRLLAVKDHDGYSLNVAYNANGRVATVTDTASRSFTFTYYAASGLLQRVTDPTGRYVEYTWESDTAPNTGAARNRIKTVRDVRGYTTTFNYTAYTSANAAIGPRIFLTSITDPRGNAPVRLTYTDTVYGNWGVDTAKDAIGNTWAFSYCAVQSNASCGGVSQAASFKTSVTAPLASASYSVKFDTAGRYTGKTDGRGNTSTVTPYPTAGLTVRNYNWAGLVNQRQTAKGFQTSFGYDTAGNANTRTNPDSGMQQSTWTAGTSPNCWNLMQRQTPEAVASNMTYTASCKLQTQRVATLAASSNTYDPTTRLLTRSTDSLTNSTDFAYDAQGNVSQVTNALGEITRYTYDPLGRQTQKTDHRGVITRYTHNEAGQVLTEAVDPLGLNLVTSYHYDANGNNDQVTDPMGNVTTMVYDAANRLTSTSRVVNSVTISTSSQYDALGRVVKSINANAHEQTTGYDENGNVVSRSDALPRTTTYAYDEDNRPLRIVDPEGRPTDYAYLYTATGRTETVTTPDGTVTRTYDKDGRLTSVTDKKGLVTSYGYDPAGRRTTVTDANNVITRMTYDDNNNLKTVADPRGNVTTYNYDKLNRRTQVVDPKNRIWQTNYDASGNVSSTSDAAGNTATYSYDWANRLVGISWSDGSSVTYVLDKNGNRTSVADATGTTLFGYDALNRVTSVTDPNGQPVTYGYDGMGNVTSLGYPGGRQVTYRYDVVDRFYQLTDWGNRNTTYTLDRSDRVTRIAHGNGTVTTKAYDTAGRLNSLVVTKPDNSVIASWALTRDGNGNITNANAQLPLQPSFPSSTVTRSYDTDNRQIGLPHDAAGRVTNTGAYALTWNAREQVTAINGQAQTYSTGGYRVAEVAGGVTTKFVTDIAGPMPSLLAEANSANVIQRYYIHSPYGLVQQIDAAGTPRYYHFDTNANAVALTDASGQITDSYAYTPYGEMTTNGTTVNPFRFAGEVGVRNFNNSPLYDMRARWYDASAGRFVSLDPLLGESHRPQSQNGYTYSEGRPTIASDPSGLAIYLQSHWILKRHGLPSAWHASLLVVPDNQAMFDQDALWVSNGYKKGGPDMVDPRIAGKYFTVVSAGPSDDLLNDSTATLQYVRNKETDMPGVGTGNIIDRQVFLKHPVTGTSLSDDEAIRKLLANAEFVNTLNLPYTYPDGYYGETNLPRTNFQGCAGYNSNSFVSGLLQYFGAGTVAPEIGNYPGWNQPIPLRSAKQCSKPSLRSMRLVPYFLTW